MAYHLIQFIALNYRKPLQWLIGNYYQKCYKKLINLISIQWTNHQFPQFKLNEETEFKILENGENFYQQLYSKR